EWQLPGLAILVTGLDTESILLQRIERRRGCLLQRNIKLPQRGGRFPKIAAQLGNSIAKRVQHLVLALGCGLLLRQDLSALAVHRPQTKNVFVTPAADRTGDVSLAPRAPAHLGHNVSREGGGSWLAHQPERGGNFAAGQNMQKRRLPQGKIQPPPQRHIEESLPGSVNEGGQDLRVLRG